MKYTAALVLVVALVTAPLAAGAQAARVYRVGVVLHGSPYYSAIDGLRDGLREAGLEEGKQFVLSVRETKSDLKSADALARNLEGENVDLIYAVTASAALGVKRGTKSVPIVFYAGSDPVALGLVESLRHPAGRLTGLYGQFTDLTPKRFEILKEMLPGLRRVVVFYNPDNPVAQQSVKLARGAASQLKLELIERRVASVEELQASLRALQPGEVDAIGYVSEAMVTSQAKLIIDTAKAKRLPTMFQERGIVAKGGLASYGVSFYTIGRLSAKLVQRVLLGADPRELPVEQLDRFHFAINLKTAKTLGLAIPPSVLARADEVIE